MLSIRYGLFLFLLFAFSNSNAQILNSTEIKLRSNFENNYWSNPDTALFYAKELSKIKSFNALKQGIHKEIFKYFLDTVKKDIQRKAPVNLQSDSAYYESIAPIFRTLQKLVDDKDQMLVKASRPLYLFAKIQQGIHNYDEVLTNVNELASCLKEGDPYENFSTRYALFSYQSIIRYKQYNLIAGNLLDAILLKLSQQKYDFEAYNTSSELLKKRSWLRSNYACANYFKALKFMAEKESQKAEQYYLKAAALSPDVFDRGYPTDEVFFIACDNSSYFEEENLKYLYTHGDKVKILKALSQATLNNPIKFKSKLRAHYNENFPGSDFKKYWSNEIDLRYTEKKDYQFTTLNKVVYTSENQKGKWVFVDFWGTWCGPCRDEHPVLQKGMDQLKNEFSKRISAVTIACHDNNETVNAYMKEFKYTFPVAIYNDKIISDFRITSYPTKILITPNGSYLKIPFSTDWYEFVKLYADVE